MGPATHLLAEAPPAGVWSAACRGRRAPEEEEDTAGGAPRFEHCRHVQLALHGTPACKAHTASKQSSHTKPGANKNTTRHVNTQTISPRVNKTKTWNILEKLGFEPPIASSLHGNIRSTSSDTWTSCSDSPSCVQSWCRHHWPPS